PPGQGPRQFPTEARAEAWGAGGGAAPRGLPAGPGGGHRPGEGAALQGVAQVAGKARDGAGGVLEGADAERVVALERERRGDLLEDGANGRLVHGRGNVRRAAETRPALPRTAPSPPRAGSARPAAR